MMKNKTIAKLIFGFLIVYIWIAAWYDLEFYMIAVPLQVIVGCAISCILYFLIFSFVNIVRKNHE